MPESQNVTKFRLMLQDPDYKGLSIVDKRAAAAGVLGDSSVNLLSDDDFNTFVTNVSAPAKKQTQEYIKSTPSTSFRQQLEDFKQSLTDRAQEGFRPGVTGIAGELARAATQSSRLGIRAPAPFVAATAANYLTGKLQTLLPNFFGQGTEHTFGDALGEAATDRIFGKTSEVAGDLLASRLKSGSFKNAITEKLGTVYPRSIPEMQELGEAAQFAKQYDAEVPTLFGLNRSGMISVLESGIPVATKTSILTKANNAYNRALKDLAGAKFNTLNEGTYNVAQTVKQKLQVAREAKKSLERASWQQVDNLTTLSNYTALHEVTETIPSLATLTPQGPTIIKKLVPVELKGAIDIQDPQAFANVLKEEGGELIQNPSQFFPGNADMQSQLTKLGGMINGLANTAPDMQSGLFLTSYAQTKALREGLQKVVKSLDGNSSQARLYGIAKSLQGLLSAAEANSIGKPQLGWNPLAAPAYEKAKEQTIERVQRYGSKNVKGVMTDPDPSKPWTLDIDNEQKYLEALKSRASAEQLVDGMNGDSTDVAATLIQQGWNKALNKDGTLDGQKFANFFYDGATNESIVNSSKIFDGQQRRILKQLTSYAKNAKFSDAAGLDWGKARVISGLFTVAAGGAFDILSGGGLGKGTALGAGLAVGIPITKQFAEKLILDKEGGRILLNRLHPTSSQNAFQNTKRLIKVLGRGAQVYLMDQTGMIRPGTVEENGKVKLDAEPGLN